MSNLSERLTTLITRSIRCSFLDGCRRFFVLPAVLAFEVGYTGETNERKRLAPDSLIHPVPTTLRMGFSSAMFFCQNVTDHCTLVGSADPPLFVRRDHSTRLMAGVQKAGLDVHEISLASGSADILGYEVSGRGVLQWNRQTDFTCSLSRTYSLFTPSHQRSGDGARQWLRVFSGAQQSWGALKF